MCVCDCVVVVVVVVEHQLLCEFALTVLSFFICVNMLKLFRVCAHDRHVLCYFFKSNAEQSVQRNGESSICTGSFSLQMLKGKGKCKGMINGKHCIDSLSLCVCLCSLLICFLHTFIHSIHKFIRSYTHMQKHLFA